MNVLKKISFLVFIFTISTLTTNSKAINNSYKQDSQNTDSLFTQAQIAYSLENYEKAYNLFNQIIALDPEYPDVYDKLAILEFAQENHTLALKYIEKARKEKPKDISIIEIQAEMLTNLGRNQEGAEAFEEIGYLEPDVKKEAFIKATVYYLEAEDFNKALELLSLLEEEELNDEEKLDIAKEKINIYITTKNSSLALKEVDNLILKAEENKDSVLAIELLQAKAIVHLEFEDTVAAKNTLLESIQKRPLVGGPNVYTYGIYSLYDIGEKELAFEKIKESTRDNSLNNEQKTFPIYALLQLRDKDEDAKELLETLLDSMVTEKNITSEIALLKGQIVENYGEKEDAIEWYEKAINLNAQNQEAYIYLIELLSSLDEKYDEKLQSTLNALHKEKDLEQGFYYFYSGTLQMKEENYKKASKIFEKGLKSLKSDGKYSQELEKAFYLNLGFANHELKNASKTRKYYELYLEKDPYNTTVLNNLSYLLAEEETDLERALEMIKYVINTDDKNPTTLDTYAWVLFKLNEVNTAKAVLEEAISIVNSRGLTSSDYIYYSHLATIEESLGNVNKAKNLNKKAEELKNKKVENK